MARAAASCPTSPSSICAGTMAVIGLATPLPAHFGADPWFGSNIETFPLVDFNCAERSRTIAWSRPYFGVWLPSGLIGRENSIMGRCKTIVVTKVLWTAHYTKLAAGGTPPDRRAPSPWRDVASSSRTYHPFEEICHEPHDSCFGP